MPANKPKDTEKDRTPEEKAARFDAFLKHVLTISKEESDRRLAEAKRHPKRWTAKDQEKFSGWIDDLVVKEKERNKLAENRTGEVKKQIVDEPPAGMQSMWTKEVPKEDGFYWARVIGVGPSVLQRYKGVWWDFNTKLERPDSTMTSFEFWSERLSPPKG